MKFNANQVYNKLFPIFAFLKSKIMQTYTKPALSFEQQIELLCAHHSRLWNHIFAIQPAKYKNPKSEKIWFSKKEVETIKSSKLYYFLCIILYMLQTINPDTKFRKHLKDLLDEYPNVNVHNMGFPSDWQDHPLWKNNFSK